VRAKAEFGVGAEGECGAPTKRAAKTRDEKVDRWITDDAGAVVRGALLSHTGVGAGVWVRA